MRSLGILAITLVITICPARGALADAAADPVCVANGDELGLALRAAVGVALPHVQAGPIALAVPTDDDGDTYRVWLRLGEPEMYIPVRMRRAGRDQAGATCWELSCGDPQPMGSAFRDDATKWWMGLKRRAAKYPRGEVGVGGVLGLPVATADHLAVTPAPGDSRVLDVISLDADRRNPKYLVVNSTCLLHLESSQLVHNSALEGQALTRTRLFQGPELRLAAHNEWAVLEALAGLAEPFLVGQPMMLDPATRRRPWWNAAIGVGAAALGGGAAALGFATSANSELARRRDTGALTPRYANELALRRDRSRAASLSLLLPAVLLLVTGTTGRLVDRPRSSPPPEFGGLAALPGQSAASRCLSITPNSFPPHSLPGESR
jgi:hypothetical protein